MNAAGAVQLSSFAPTDYSVRTACTIGLLRAVRRNAEPSVLRDFVQSSGDLLRSELLRCGAVLLRGFDIRTVQEFDALWGGTFRPHYYRYTMTEPGRRRLGAHTVNSNYTRIHGALGVLRFHHENLHLPRAEAPEWIAFGCLEAPERGGETGIVNTASAYDDLPDGLKDKLLSFSQQFELRIPSSSWKSELDADDEAGAVDVCSKLGYRVLRASATELVVSFERPCVETHRFTGRRSIFLDRSSYGMPSEFAMTFRECYGAGWTWFRALQGVMQPYEVLRAGYRFYQTHVRRRWVALARDERAELSRACAAHVAAVRYEPGDVLLVDNLLVEHTALPWTGGRKIAVAMGAYGPTAAPWSEMPDAA